MRAASNNLFVAPLTLPEYIADQLTISLMRALIGVGGACVFAFLIFNYSIFSIGLPLAAFFLRSRRIRLGHRPCDVGDDPAARPRCRGLAWAAVFIIAPISGVYYPIGVLPLWLQAVALSIPSAHVFEGMRSVLLTGVFRWDHFWMRARSILSLALGAAVFAWAMRDARDRGTLLQMGE
jgi:ABC-2 type transport system permease protein